MNTTPWSSSEDGVTRIKICGISDPEMATIAVEAGAHAIGCVLATGSPRTVTHETAIAIASTLPDEVDLVGVFVDGDLERDLLPWQPRWTQLHGKEDMATVQALSGPVIRAVPFEEATVRNWDTCEGVDRLLIDSARAGSGTAFDHEALEPMLNALTTPIIVAGGLTPESIGDVIRRLRPWGVDVSSGVESAPGIKNPALIHEFCAAVHEADDAAN